MTDESNIQREMRAAKLADNAARVARGAFWGPIIAVLILLGYIEYKSYQGERLLAEMNKPVDLYPHLSMPKS